MSKCIQIEKNICFFVIAYKLFQNIPLGNFCGGFSLEVEDSKLWENQIEKTLTFENVIYVHMQKGLV